MNQPNTPDTLQKKEEIGDTTTEVIMSPEDQREDQAEIDNPQWSTEAGFLTIDSLPEDVKRALPKDAQMVYVAAYNAIFEGNSDREAATKTAWQSIEHSDRYVRGEDGTWKSVEPDQGLHNPSPLSSS